MQKGGLWIGILALSLSCLLGCGSELPSDISFPALMKLTLPTTIESDNSQLQHSFHQHLYCQNATQSALLPSGTWQALLDADAPDNLARIERHPSASQATLFLEIHHEPCPTLADGTPTHLTIGSKGHSSKLQVSKIGGNALCGGPGDDDVGSMPKLSH